MNQVAANSNVDPPAKGFFDLKPAAAPVANTEAALFMHQESGVHPISEDSFGLMPSAAPVANTDAVSYANQAPVAADTTSSDVGESNLKSPPEDTLLKRMSASAYSPSQRAPCQPSGRPSPP